MTPFSKSTFDSPTLHPSTFLRDVHTPKTDFNADAWPGTCEEAVDWTDGHMSELNSAVCLKWKLFVASTSWAKLFTYSFSIESSASEPFPPLVGVGWPDTKAGAARRHEGLRRGDASSERGDQGSGRRCAGGVPIRRARPADVEASFRRRVRGATPQWTILRPSAATLSRRPSSCRPWPPSRAQGAGQRRRRSRRRGSRRGSRGRGIAAPALTRWPTPSPVPLGGRCGAQGRGGWTAACVCGWPSIGGVRLQRRPTRVGVRGAARTRRRQGSAGLLAGILHGLQQWVAFRRSQSGEAGGPASSRVRRHLWDCCDRWPVKAFSFLSGSWVIDGHNASSPFFQHPSGLLWCRGGIGGPRRTPRWPRAPRATLDIRSTVLGRLPTSPTIAKGLGRCEARSGMWAEAHPRPGSKRTADSLSPYPPAETQP